MRSKSAGKPASARYTKAFECLAKRVVPLIGAISHGIEEDLSVEEAQTRMVLLGKLVEDLRQEYAAASHRINTDPLDADEREEAVRLLARARELRDEQHTMVPGFRAAWDSVLANGTIAPRDLVKLRKALESVDGGMREIR